MQALKEKLILPEVRKFLIQLALRKKDLSEVEEIKIIRNRMDRTYEIRNKIKKRAKGENKEESRKKTEKRAMEEEKREQRMNREESNG